MPRILIASTFVLALFAVAAQPAAADRVKAKAKKIPARTVYLESRDLT